MRRILITGGSGQVGIELLRLPWTNEIQLVAPTRKELDLSDCDSVESYVTEGEFCAVVNSGAYTAVDRAESDVVTTWKINALAPAAIAAATGKFGIPMVHVSTDYVFDGSKGSYYREEDPVAPLGVYGASKEAGEQAVRTANPRHVILRTAWLFSAHRSNFVKTMLRLGEERKCIRIVNDQHGSPTAASDVALTIATIVRRLTQTDDAPVGTYNFVNAGEATWYQFAQEIFRQRQRGGCGVPALEPVRTDQYPTPARRPANSRLSTDKIMRDFGVHPQHWTTALRQTLASLPD